MKTKAFFSLMFLIVSTFLCLPHTVADYEPHTQWSLPEGAIARLGKGTIGEIAYSPDGTQLAVGSSIGIWIYDVQTGEELDLLTGHSFPAWSVSFSPDGTTLASGSRDTTIRLWNTNTGKTIRTLTGHTSGVDSVSFSPDGTTLASGSGDRTVRLWDVATATHKATLTGHTGIVGSVSFSPDGTTLASGSDDQTVRLWDVATATHKATLTGHTADVWSVAFSPDGTTLASGSYDGTILLWALGPKKDIVVSFRLENGKKVTLYRENEDTLVYTFGTPGEKPELEYKGPMLADLDMTAALWSEGASEGTSNLKELASWTAWSKNDQDIIDKAANAPDSQGFIEVSDLTGLFSESTYIFRTGGWEYAIVRTWGRRSDYSEKSLIVISPDGKVHHLR